MIFGEKKRALVAIIKNEKSESSILGEKEILYDHATSTSLWIAKIYIH